MLEQAIIFQLSSSIHIFLFREQNESKKPQPTNKEVNHSFFNLPVKLGKKSPADWALELGLFCACTKKKSQSNGNEAFSSE